MTIQAHIIQDISHKDTPLTHCGTIVNSQGQTTVIRIHLLGTVNLDIRIVGEIFQSGELTDTVYRAVPLVWLEI